MKHRIESLIIFLITMAVSCDKAVDFPAEESGKIYINAIMTDTGLSKMDVGISQPIGGTKSESAQNVKLTLTADGETVELVPDADKLREGILSLTTDTRFTAGQELTVRASCNGLPSVCAEVTIPAELPEILVLKSEAESYKTDSPGQYTDQRTRLWKFDAKLREFPDEESYFGMQVIKRKLYEYYGEVPDDEKKRLEKEAGISEVDDLYVNTIMEVNGAISSIETQMVVEFDGGETAIAQASGNSGQIWINAWVKPTEKTLLSTKYDPIMGINYAIYEYYEYKIKIYRLSYETYCYLKARYISDNTTLPLHLGFTPATYTYTNVVGGIGIFAAVTTYESEWTRYE